MEREVAAVVTHDTRQSAVQQSGEDLRQLLRRAVEAGRQRSRDLIKVTTITQTSGQIRHNPAGRVLRDWYFHVYLNTLRERLGQPSEPIDAQQVEDTAQLLARLRPGSDPLRALQATGVARNSAVADAAGAVVTIVTRLRELGQSRAIAHAPDERFDGDKLRVHVSRHWFQRCYDDAVDGAVAARHPLAGVTDAEEEQVARILTTAEARRLIGRDGIPLLTEFGTRLTGLDKALSTQGVMPVSRERMQLVETDATAPLAERVKVAWGALSVDDRQRWLRRAGATPTEQDVNWSRLDGQQQLQLLRHYVTVQLREHGSRNFSGSRVDGAAPEAAALIFNHPPLARLTPLATTPNTDVEASGPPTVSPGLIVARSLR